METDTSERDDSQSGSVPLLTVSKNHKVSAEMPISPLQHYRKPAAVPPLQPLNSEEKRRFIQGKQRRQIRQELEKRYRELKDETL